LEWGSRICRARDAGRAHRRRLEPADLGGGHRGDRESSFDAKRAFVNRIRSLFNIDGYLLPELTSQARLEFLRDPVRYFLNTDDAQSHAIMREVESRQTGESSDFSTLFSVDAPAAPSLAKEEDNAELKAVEKPATAKAPRGTKAKPRVEGQREMLLPISGKKTEEKKPVQLPTSRSSVIG
jgi:hypothetical protein